jgi:hypothetical protein
MTVRIFAKPRLFPLLLLLLFASAVGGPLPARAQVAKANPRPTPRVGFRVAGTVVNSKTSQPLARATVSVTDTKNPKNAQSLVTGEDGRFQFLVSAGKYSLLGTKHGFLPFSYEQHENFWTAIVTGAGLETENLILRLPPPAIISGKVTDDFGEPVRRATVTVFSETHRAGVSRIQPFSAATTDDLGTYELEGLGAGTYFLCASAQPWFAEHLISSQASAGMASLIDRDLDVAYPVSYYKEATESEDATPIPLRAADQIEVDFHMSAVPALHLVFHIPPDASGQYEIPILRKPAFDSLEGASVDGQVEQISPGLYEMTGLAGGRYSLQERASTQGAMRGSTDVDLASDGQEFDLSAGAQGASVKMTVRLRGGAELPANLYIALHDEKGRVGAVTEVNDKGEVAFSGVLPGTYEVVAGAISGKSYSVARIASEEGVTSGHSLSVAAGASLQLSAVLVGGTATVEGVAQRQGKAAAAAMIVLVPDDPAANMELFRRDQSDLDGSFALAQVVPGNYTILAIADGWDLDWAKPAVIESYRQHGQKIVVRESDKNPIHLPAPVEVQAKR